MNYIRRAKERGAVDLGWLQSYHSFSFGQYFDANHMGVSALRVINDDTVQAGQGFGEHGHRDMEIISYVTQGALQHRDSHGNSHLVRAGEIQRMSAGTGIVHSEFNASTTDPVKFLQIWILPEHLNVTPSYEQKNRRAVSSAYAFGNTQRKRWISFYESGRHFVEVSSRER